jgi:hypothetical protein
MTVPDSLRPYFLGYHGTSATLIDRNPYARAEAFDIFDPSNQAFYRLVNAGNRLAFQGIGMPPWVQLDCCTLPSAMIGFCVDRSDIDDSVWDQLVVYTEQGFGPGSSDVLFDYDGPVPVSQFCAVASLVPGTMVGFSLFTLLRGGGLGVRTKALGLHCYDPKFQIGMTQYTNAAVRTHCRFGPLEILEPVAWPHLLQTETFIYRLDLEGVDLAAMALHGARRVDRAPDGVLRVALGPATHAGVEAARVAHGSVKVAPPGHADGHLLLLPG